MADALKSADAVVMGVDPRHAPIPQSAQAAVMGALATLPFCTTSAARGDPEGLTRVTWTAFDGLLDEGAPAEETESAPKSLWQHGLDHVTSDFFRAAARSVAPGVSPYRAKGLLVRLVEATEGAIARIIPRDGLASATAPVILDTAQLPSPWPGRLDAATVIRDATAAGTRASGVDIVLASMPPSHSAADLARSVSAVSDSVRDEWWLVALLHLTDGDGKPRNPLPEVHKTISAEYGGAGVADLALAGLPGRDYLPFIGLATFRMWR